MRQRGTIKTWNDDRGFGFIRPEESGPDVFLHISALPPSANRPKVGERVQYDLVPGTAAKPRAKGVTFADRAPEPAPRPNQISPRSGPPARAKARPRRAESEPSGATWSLPRLLVIPAFAAYWWWLAQDYGFEPLLLFVYLGVSTLAFLIYASDKYAAQAKRWRVPEGTLLALSFWCGWPGALIAQQTLRHKNRKISFVVPYWLSVIGNWVLFYVWHAQAWKLLLPS